MQETNVYFGVLSLDQEKAFDRGGHSCLFSALRPFGFNGFMARVGLLYNGGQCLGAG